MAGMFVLQEDGSLVGLDERAYDSEELLQSLLASHPDLLAGEQMTPDAPRHWLLVSREAGVPDAPEASGRWSIDHLFLDQDGIPTLVEVKRSSDTRIRREVVGQMLDYAANAVVYLPVEQIRATYEARCARDGGDPAAVLADAFGPDIDPDSYWVRVKTNLEAGHVRLVFVADLIPPELRRIVEFLNGQLNPAEVYAVEITQYVGAHLRTLVPRLIGRTAEAGRAKSAGGSDPEPWTSERFAAELEARVGPEAVRRAQRVLAWAESRGVRVWWGRGSQHGGFVAVVDGPDGSRHPLFEVWTDGAVEILFQHLASKPPFAEPRLRQELATRLTAGEGVQLPEGRLDKRPSFPLLAPSDDAALDTVLAAFDWALGEIRRAAGSGV